MSVNGSPDAPKKQSATGELEHHASGAQSSAEEKRPSAAQMIPIGTGSFGSGPSRSARILSSSQDVANQGQNGDAPRAHGFGDKQRPTLLGTLGNRSSLTTMSVTDLNTLKAKRTEEGVGAGAGGGGTVGGRLPDGATAGSTTSGDEAGNGAGNGAGDGASDGARDGAGDDSEAVEEAEPDWIDSFSLAHVTSTSPSVPCFFSPLDSCRCR